MLYARLQRNQFLEAESVVMEKERNQIRFEMRGLLVNNEDLLRTNTQMQGELNRMRERIVELESNNNVMIERFKQMEVRHKHTLHRQRYTSTRHLHDTNLRVCS